jgi:uncharacterized protein (DUF1330 family)
MAVFLLAAIDHINREGYGAYEAGGFASVAKFGVEPVAVSDNLTVLEGTAPGSRVVLMKFQDQASLDAWYNSPEYQSVIPIRQANSETKFLVTFEGL